MHYSVIVVGGGQAGLSLSYYLKQAGIDHLVLEKNTRHAHLAHAALGRVLSRHAELAMRAAGLSVRRRRPARLHEEGRDHRVSRWLHRARSMRRCSKRAAVHARDARRRWRLTRSDDRTATFTADQVVVASGGYHTPIVPRMAERLPQRIVQMQSSEYRNAARAARRRGAGRRLGAVGRADRGGPAPAGRKVRARGRRGAALRALLSRHAMSSTGWPT